MRKIDEARLDFRIGQPLYCAKTNEFFTVMMICADESCLTDVLGAVTREGKRYLYWQGEWATSTRRPRYKPLRRSHRANFDDFPDFDFL